LPIPTRATLILPVIAILIKLGGLKFA